MSSISAETVPPVSANIREVREEKKQYLPLLLLGDEQEEMISRYLESGTMYVLEDDGVKAECVVTAEPDRILEIRNIAVYPGSQGKGYGRALIRFLEKEYRGRFRSLQAGTGDSPLTVPFYEKCGFAECGRVPGYFEKHYDHPIIEGGVRLSDLVVFRKELQEDDDQRDIG